MLPIEAIIGSDRPLKLTGAPAGMMPLLAAALNVSVGEIGYLISLYALGMAVGGPVLGIVHHVPALDRPNKQERWEMKSAMFLNRA